MLFGTTSLPPSAAASPPSPAVRIAQRRRRAKSRAAAEKRSIKAKLLLRQFLFTSQRLLASVPGYAEAFVDDDSCTAFLLMAMGVEEATLREGGMVFPPGLTDSPNPTTLLWCPLKQLCEAQPFNEANAAGRTLRQAAFKQGGLGAMLVRLGVLHAMKPKDQNIMAR